MKFSLIKFCAILLLFGIGARVLPLRAQTLAPFLILSPAPGEVAVGKTVLVEVQLPDGFTLADPDRKPAHIEGEGHLHIWLDASPNHEDETSAVLIDNSRHVYENVFSGLHTIYAEFYRNDHRSYEPRLFDQVEFETYQENLVPRDENGDKFGAPPISDGGLFLPPEGGNTLIAIITALLTIGVLWYLFGRARKD